jgi:phage shock protein E
MSLPQTSLGSNFAAMDWTIWLVLGVVVIGFAVIKRAAFVSVESAGQMLRQNAKIIDVRTEAEFRSEHVPGAINIPLSDLENRVARVVPDKNQVLLVHCLSGGRSAIAKGKLRKMGYAKVHNLGSLGRAKEAAKN